MPEPMASQSELNGLTKNCTKNQRGREHICIVFWWKFCHDLWHRIFYNEQLDNGKLRRHVQRHIGIEHNRLIDF